MQGFWAYVKEIQIFHTVLENFDQTEAILPNSVIMSGTIENLSATPTRSISIVVGIPFGEDIGKVMRVLMEAVYSVPEVDQSAEPFLWIRDFESHYMKMSAGFSTSNEGFWTTDYKVRKAVIDAFVKHKIKVAYPTGVEYGAFGQWPREGPH